MPRTPSFTARPILLAAMAVSVSGCGAYLHRPALETATAKIQTDVKALPVPAYLAEQQKRLTEFAVEEDKALAGYLTATRDLSLLNVVEPSAGSTSKATPAERLRSKVDEELQRLAGLKIIEVPGDDSYRFVDDQLSKTLQTAASAAATHQRRASSLARLYEVQIAEYRSHGGKAFTDCTKVLANSSGPADEPVEARQAYELLSELCRQIASNKKRELDCTLGVGGELKNTCNRLTPKGESELKKRAEELGKAIQALRTLATADDEGSPTDQIRKLLADAEEAVGSVSVLSTDEKYAKVILALNKAFSIELGKVLEEISSAPKGKKAAAAKDRLLASLGLIDAIDKVAAPNGDPLDEPSALLIGMAKTQHDLNIVNIELAEETALAALAGQEAQAIRTALHFFARARDILCPGNPPCRTRHGSLNQPAVAEALGYFVSGYNQGLIPFKVLQFREIQVRRASAIRRAQVAEADYRALIQPAIDQIAAYGHGGIKPEHLAPLLGSLPVPTL